jgi:ribosome-associated translation inhibitor RaiA
MNEKPLSDLKDASTPPPEAVDSTGRSAQRFVVEAEVRGSSGKASISVQGQDIYAVSAPLVVAALEKMLKREKLRGGVFAPGEVFDADAFLAQLSPRFLESIHHDTE